MKTPGFVIDGQPDTTLAPSPGAGTVPSPERPDKDLDYDNIQA